jgi:hypothetical protein
VRDDLEEGDAGRRASKDAVAISSHPMNVVKTD